MIAYTMVLSRKLRWVLLLTFVQIYCPNLVKSRFDNYPIANLSTSWTNSPSSPHSLNFTDGSTVRAVLSVTTVLSGRVGLLSGNLGPQFACGFYCNGNCDTYLFAIFIVRMYKVFPNDSSTGVFKPQVVWSANRNYPVRTNATLQLTSEGNLVLRDVDGTIAWSTNTSGKSVAGLNLTETGNLVLFDVNNKIVWQSFDHPTDSLVLGQKLMSGKKLTASVSATNWTQADVYSLSVTSEGLFAFIESNPPQAYFKYQHSGKAVSSVEFLNGNLSFFLLDAESSDSVMVFWVPKALSVQYMRLEHDGHLRVHEEDIQKVDGWKEVADLLTVGECGYPLVCGKYGICSGKQCLCPGLDNGTAFFKHINDKKPELGCLESTPLTCEASQDHRFLELKDTVDFTPGANLSYITETESCKQACLKNCSCKAVMIQYGSDYSLGRCYFLSVSQIFSLISIEAKINSSNNVAFLKVQIGPSAPDLVPLEKKTGRVVIKVGSSVGTFFGLFIVVSILVFILRRKRDANEAEVDYLDQVPGMPTRFSYAELKAATKDFSTKLGEGGFGSVFEGTLRNGMVVAVKRLEGLGHIKKSFLAEVETIGSIHHVNLLRLIGFSAEKFHMLLVYEYICNGSLDKWIFHKNHELALDWQRRRKIILGIAKGLAYLHEDCRQKIVHLDIKPQNILLDENFNAKVSDFGLAKLIDRDQSQVMTSMRGTIGYLAPEWLSSVITEKVDVYSYGVVVLEILCGRKILDRSQPEEYMHLLSLFKKKAEEGQLLDMVDKYSEDMQLHGSEVVEMMRLATWCLQSDFARRPSMSVVVKVLEGSVDVEDNLDYNFTNPPLSGTIVGVGHDVVNFGASTPLLPSLLSGPR